MSGMTLSKNDTAGTKIRVGCSRCQVNTNHVVLAAVDLTGCDGEAGIEYGESYQIIECQGCERRSFRATNWNSEDVNPEDETLLVREELYPDFGKGRRPLEDTILMVPVELQRIYDETIAALNHSQPILCGVGVRAIIETIVKHQNAIGDDLMKKIDSLVTAELLTKPGAEILHKLRTLGNNAAHQVKAHTAAELSLALDVIDNLLQNIYILPAKAASTLK
jgi:hypothetical protein